MFCTNLRVVGFPYASSHAVTHKIDLCDLCRDINDVVNVFWRVFCLLLMKLNRAAKNNVEVF